MEDLSIYNTANPVINNGADKGQLINECIKEVLLKGDTLSKYQKQIEKIFGEEFYSKCDDFVKEVMRSVENKKFSNTSVINLKYLAKEIGIPMETVDIVINHYSTLFDKGKRNESGYSKWIAVFLIAILGVVCYIAFNKNEAAPPSPAEYYSNVENRHTDINEVPQRDNSQDEDIESHSSSHIICINMSGRIGNALESRCTMYYDQDSDTGEFSYDLNGDMVKRKLKLASYDNMTNKLVLKEYTNNGDIVGEFSGEYTGNTYKGTFTNTSNGAIIPFSLEN